MLSLSSYPVSIVAFSFSVSFSNENARSPRFLVIHMSFLQNQEVWVLIPTLLLVCLMHTTLIKSGRNCRTITYSYLKENTNNVLKSTTKAAKTNDVFRREFHTV